MKIFYCILSVLNSLFVLVCIFKGFLRLVLQIALIFHHHRPGEHEADFVNGKSFHSLNVMTECCINEKHAAFPLCLSDRQVISLFTYTIYFTGFIVFLEP